MSTASLQRRHPVDRPLDLRATLGFPMGNLALRHDAEGSWWASRWESGPATVRLRVQGGDLVVDAWGPGAEQAVEEAPQVCGLHDDDASLPAVHPRVEHARRRFPGLRVRRTRKVLETIVRVVIGQRVTTEGARRSLHDLMRRHGAEAPGPAGLRLQPDAGTLATLSYAHLHPCGIERQRAVVILRAARQARRLEEIVDLPRAEAYARLVAVPGIGPWTAALVMAEAWGDADAVPLGDYHLPSTMAWHLAGERQADDRRMVELLRPFMGHRWRVIRLLTQLADRSPRRGPRTEVADIRGI